MVNSQSFFSTALISAVIVSIALILAATSFNVQPIKENLPDIEWDMSFSLSDRQRSSLDLRFPDESFKSFSGLRLSIPNNFAYVWITLRNSGPVDRELFVTNATRNYSTELLEPTRSGALTLFKQGDTTPVSLSPIRYQKAVFPVLVESGSTRNLILEYHGPRGIVIDPGIVSPTAWFSGTAFERNLGSIVSGSLLALLVFNLIAGVMLGRKKFYILALFIIALLFFFLRQSRILLLLFDTWYYPEWLYPLSIAANFVCAMILSFSLFGLHFRAWQSVVLKFCLSLSFVATGLSFFFHPYLMADILNVVSLFGLAIVFLGVYRAFYVKDHDAVMITLAFAPWIIMMILDILGVFAGIRQSQAQEFRQVFGLIATLILLTTTLIFQKTQSQNSALKMLGDQLDALRSESSRQLVAVGNIRASLRLQVIHELRFPLDGIIASAGILKRGYSNPGVLAGSQEIIGNARMIKQLIETEADALQKRPEEDIESAAEPTGETTSAAEISFRQRERVCIFDLDSRHAAQTSLILQAEGFDAYTLGDRYRILSEAAEGKIDILIVDPSHEGEGVFSLCVLLRETRNMLQLPILMITNYYADYLMKKGYASGVNDFLARPFDAFELVTRIHSLVKLREVAHHNTDLSKSGTEKDAFLYFLTHNVNTPLTLLLNRVHELAELEDLGELPEIVDDLQVSTREINDIVQNVLISFRLSDGRQTVRLEETELLPILQTIGKLLQKKADAKNQSFMFEVPQSLSPVQGDRTALYGILYNVIDNAIKFAPRSGSIRVAVRQEEMVRIEVRDDGPGIPKDDQCRLFGRFERLSTRPTGGESSTGLGLYVAQELALMNGAQLGYVDNSEGACFVLSLPLYHDQGDAN